MANVGQGETRDFHDIEGPSASQDDHNEVIIGSEGPYVGTGGSPSGNCEGHRSW